MLLTLPDSKNDYSAAGSYEVAAQSTMEEITIARENSDAKVTQYNALVCSHWLEHLIAQHLR
jgi:hypothetical protein